MTIWSVVFAKYETKTVHLWGKTKTDNLWSNANRGRGKHLLKSQKYSVNKAVFPRALCASDPHIVLNDLSAKTKYFSVNTFSLGAWSVKGKARLCKTQKHSRCLCKILTLLTVMLLAINQFIFIIAANYVSSRFFCWKCRRGLCFLPHFLSSIWR